MSQYPPQPGGAPQQATGVPIVQTTNGFAIASLVVSLIGGTIIAVILGHVARKQIRETGQAGDGLAIAGLVIGYIGLVALVLGVIFWVVVVGAAITMS